MNLVGEVCRVEMTDGHTIFLGLRKPRGGEEDPKEQAKMWAETFLGMGIPDDMSKKFTEGMGKMAQAQHEKHLEQASHFELSADYILELTDQEYEKLGKPGIGTELGMTLEVAPK